MSLVLPKLFLGWVGKIALIMSEDKRLGHLSACCIIVMMSICLIGVYLDCRWFWYITFLVKRKQHMLHGIRVPSYQPGEKLSFITKIYFCVFSLHKHVVLFWNFGFRFFCKCKCQKSAFLLFFLQVIENSFKSGNFIMLPVQK